MSIPLHPTVVPFLSPDIHPHKMSGLTTSTQTRLASDRPSGSDTSSSADDPAASLRAAALLTLKSNRRKATSGIELPPSLPPRPVTSTTSFELDYGTEEPAAGTSSKSSSVAPPAVAPRPPSAPPPEPMDVDDGQAREEGEISDTESTPAPKSPPAPPTRAVQSKPQQPPIVKQPLKDRPNHLSLVPPPPLPVKLEPKSSLMPEARLSPITLSKDRLSPSTNGTILIDDTHVRPGLASTYASPHSGHRSDFISYQ